MGDRTLANFVSFETFEHDEDGDMTKRTLASTGEEISYEWTELDRLKRVESDTNGRRQNARYGVDGLRTKKQDANGNSSREYGAGISTSASTPLTLNSTAPSISYISGPVILGAEINGEFVYHLGDALSTVRDVVDDQGDVIRSFEFDEYGNMLNSSGTGAASPKTWIGGLSVNDDRADSGLWNMGHRNYAGGVLGRFISRDPIGFSGGLNLYVYPTNPVNFVDPSGFQPTYADEIVDSRSSTGPRMDAYQHLLKWGFQLQAKTGYRHDLSKGGLVPSGKKELSGLQAYSEFIKGVGRVCERENLKTEDFVDIMQALSLSNSGISHFHKSGGRTVNPVGLQGPNAAVMFPQSGFASSLQDSLIPASTEDQSHHLTFFVSLGFHAGDSLRSTFGPLFSEPKPNAGDTNLGHVGAAYGKAIPHNTLMKDWKWRAWTDGMCNRLGKDK